MSCRWRHSVAARPTERTIALGGAGRTLGETFRAIGKVVTLLHDAEHTATAIAQNAAFTFAPLVFVECGQTGEIRLTPTLPVLVPKPAKDRRGNDTIAHRHHEQRIVLQQF